MSSSHPHTPDSTANKTACNVSPVLQQDPPVPRSKERQTDARGAVLPCASLPALCKGHRPRSSGFDSAIQCDKKPGGMLLPPIETQLPLQEGGDGFSLLALSIRRLASPQPQSSVEAKRSTFFCFIGESGLEGQKRKAEGTASWSWSKTSSPLLKTENSLSAVRCLSTSLGSLGSLVPSNLGGASNPLQGPLCQHTPPFSRGV